MNDVDDDIFIAVAVNLIFYFVCVLVIYPNYAYIGQSEDACFVEPQK
jgi:hypothetical protein